MLPEHTDPTGVEVTPSGITIAEASRVTWGKKLDMRPLSNGKPALFFEGNRVPQQQAMSEP